MIFGRASGGALLGIVVVALVGCHKKPAAGSDAAADAAVAQADAAPAEEATNAADVTRFPDEAKLDHVAATIQAPTASARKAPTTGAVIATLAKGANVVQLAEKDKFVLALFDDPKDASKKIEGWISQDAFNASAHHKPTITNPCPAGQTLLLAEQDFCGHVCKTNKDCPAGHACTGQASLFSLDGGVGATVSTCVGGGPDAGAHAGTASQDGGTGQSIAGVQQPPDAKGGCPRGFVLASDKLCHKMCNAAGNAECPPHATCSSKMAKEKVCVAGHAP